jgi:hypothetical protein
MHRLRLLLVLFFCCVATAYANNPPQPDGLFSILLIFPVVILGRRLAAVPPVQKTLWKRIVVTLVLTACVVLCMAGTELALIPLLGIAGYGIVRATQILHHGQGRKRIVVGVALLGLVLFAVTDYVASLLSYDPGPVLESIAVSRLRSLATAEGEFRTPAYSKGLSSPVYGTMAELENAKLLEWNLTPNIVRSGYVYGEIIDKPQNRFLFYAVPAFLHHSPSKWFHIVPGGSLLLGILGRDRPPETGERSFAVDESGVLRVSPHWAPDAPVSREEALSWQILQ